jgi:hypothetical protein
MGVLRVISTVFLAAWGLYPTLALAQRQLVPTYQDVGVTTTGRWPRLHNGLLAGCDVYCEGAPILSLTDKLGSRQTVNLNIPGSDYVYVRDVAAGADNSLVAVGVALSGDSRTGTFIAWISPDRARQTITRTWPYSPFAVAVAADGTIWTAGSVMTQSGLYLNPNVIRHYTSSGQLLASTIVSGARQHNGMWDGSHDSRLMVSGDRVGWFTEACQYFEFSLDDVQLGRYDCPPGMSITQVGGIALSSADDVLIATKQVAPLTVVALDRSTGNWQQVVIQPDSGKQPKHVYGFDGLTLVTNANSNQVRRYSWSN